MKDKRGEELSNDTNVTTLRKVLKPDSLGFFTDIRFNREVRNPV